MNINGYVINNAPDYAKDYPYIVVRMCDDALWFYGAYDDVQQAVKAKSEIGGIIVVKSD